MPHLKPTRGTQLIKPDGSPAGRMVDSLIAGWLMNEGSGNKVFDLSGNGNTGTLSATTTWEAHRILCDVNGKKVSFPMPAFGPIGTVVFSFNGSGTPALNGYLFTGTTGVFGFIRDKADTALIFQVGGDGNYFVSPDLWDGTEKIIAVTWNDITNWRHLYVNGVLAEAEENAFAWSDPGATFYIGDRSTNARSAGGSYGWFYGYNQDLSASEIALLNREPFCMFERKISPAYFFVSDVGAIALDGTIAAQSNVSGDIKVAKKITGTIDAQSVVSGDIKVAKKITGTITAQSVVSGDIEVAKEISGTIAAQSVVSGDLTVVGGGAVPLTGTIAAQSVVSGDIEVAKEISGTIAAQSVVSGDIEVAKNITGIIAAQSNVTGDLTIAGAVPLTGIIEAISEVVGDIKVAKNLTGACGAQSNVSGILSVKKNLTGIVTATSGVSGDLTNFVFLTGSIIASSTMSSPGLEVLKNLTGQIQASGSVAGNILVIKLLTGNVLATSNVIGELSLLGAVEAEIDLPDDWMWIADMINEDGRDMSITVPGGPIDPNEPWRGNSPGTPVLAKGIFVKHTSKEITGDHVKRQEQKLLVAPASNIIISEGTKIVDSIDNSDWYVKDFKKITEETDILLYILEVRQ